MSITGNGSVSPVSPVSPTSSPEHPAPALLHVTPWSDPVVDRFGYEVRSPYVERYWLGVLGPSCVLLARRLGELFADAPEGFTLDLAECAQSLGLGTGVGRHAPMSRTITRLAQFGMAQRYGRDRLAMRRFLPPLARHHLARLPAALQQAHDEEIAAAHLRSDAA